MVDGGSTMDSGCDRGCRVLVVDDHRLLRELLCASLVDHASEVAEAWDGVSASEEIARCDPDVVLVNMSNRDAAFLLNAVAGRRSGAKIIAYGLAEDDESAIASCIEVGVAGYHLRDESVADLAVFMRTVLDGEPACSSRFSALLLRRLPGLSTRVSRNGDNGLTVREHEILEMLAMGLSNRDIAERLCIAVHTVKNHVHSLLTKIGARSRAEAAAIYHRNPQSVVGTLGVGQGREMSPPLPFREDLGLRR